MKKAQILALVVLLVTLAAFVAQFKWGGLGFSDGR